MENPSTALLKYLVISPVRNEAEYIEKTIESMIHQTIQPVLWVIVNDGSKDATESIVQKYAQLHPWIRLVNRPDRGIRQRGKGVIDAFNSGLETVIQDYDFIVKLDGDVSFGPVYFECLLQKFFDHPRLGIAGGGLYEKPNGRDWVLYAVKEHVRGCTKVYQRECFEAIGGLVPAMGWDGIDEWKALSMGWKVQSFLELKIYHYRFTGAATGFLKSYREQGKGAYRMGYHPLYQLARSIRHMKNRPYVIGGIEMFGAYCFAWLRKEERLADPAVIRYIQQSQMKTLYGLFEKKSVRQDELHDNISSKGELN